MTAGRAHARRRISRAPRTGTDVGARTRAEGRQVERKNAFGGVSARAVRLFLGRNTICMVRAMRVSPDPPPYALLGGYWIKQGQRRSRRLTAGCCPGVSRRRRRQSRRALDLVGFSPFSGPAPGGGF